MIYLACCCADERTATRSFTKSAGKAPVVVGAFLEVRAVKIFFSLHPSDARRARRRRNSDGSPRGQVVANEWIRMGLVHGVLPYTW
jgi:hypothetical protein